MHGMNYYGWGWGMGFGWVLMLLFWVLVIVGIVYLVRAVMGGAKGKAGEETALDILKKRYAKGEISKEEFEERKKELKD